MRQLTNAEARIQIQFLSLKPQALKKLYHVCTHAVLFCGYFFSFNTDTQIISWKAKSHIWGHICIQQWLAPIRFWTQNKPRLPADWSLLVDKTRCFLINHPRFSSGFCSVFPHRGPSSSQLQLHSQCYSHINVAKYWYSGWLNVC